MRRFFLFLPLAALFFYTQTSHAQITVGVKTGIHFADARVEGFANDFLPEPEVYSGFAGGVFVELPMLNGFSFRPELNYVQKGFQAMQNLSFSELEVPVGAGLKTRINNLEVPLLFKYTNGNEVAKWYIIAGPNVSYATDAWARPVVRAIIEFTLPRQDINLSNDIYRRWDISATGGVGGEIKAGEGKIIADLRYTHGFANFFDNPVIDVQLRNQGFTLSAGYAYTF
jgi:hypothetical protein